MDMHLDQNVDPLSKLSMSKHKNQKVLKVLGDPLFTALSPTYSISGAEGVHRISSLSGLKLKCGQLLSLFCAMRGCGQTCGQERRHFVRVRVQNPTCLMYHRSPSFLPLSTPII